MFRDTLRKNTTIILFYLSFLTLAGPIMDYMNGVDAFLGRINNMSLIAIIPIFWMGPFLLNKAKSHTEKWIFFSLCVALIAAIYITRLHHINTILSLSGLASIWAAITLGITSYVLGRDGRGVHKRIMFAVLATVPALIIPPLLIHSDPDAYSAFWLNVYGYSNVRVFGYFAAAAVVVLSGCFSSDLLKLSKIKFYIWCIALQVSWSLLFWSGSRAGVVAAILAILIVCLIFSSRAIVNFLISMACAVSGALISLFYYTPDKAFGLINRVQDTADRMAQGGLAKVSSNRFDMWNWALGKIFEEPYLGHGYLSMRSLNSEKFNFYHTHNLIIEYLLSFGLYIGSAMLLLGLCLWVRALIAARRIGTPTAMSLAMLITVLPIYSMFSATLFFPYHLMFFMAGIGSLIGWDCSRKQPEETEEPAFKAQADWMFDDLDVAQNQQEIQTKN